MMNSLIVDNDISKQDVPFLDNLSKREVKQRIINIAEMIKESTFVDKPKVAILINSRVDAAIAIYAAIYLGGCYIPIDTQQPKKRISDILMNTGVDIVIADTTLPLNFPVAIPWLDVTEGSITQATTKTYQPTVCDEDSAAVIIYTSGSTGTPKGIAISYLALKTFVDWSSRFVISGDCIASITPFYFDLSFFDLFTSFAMNVQVKFIPKQLTLSPAKLTDWLIEQNINVMYTVPSLLSFITLKGGLDKKSIPSMKTILFAGEIFATKYLLQLLSYLPRVNFYNLFGPTETNVISYWYVNKKDLNSGYPIGYSACQSQLRIDEKTGELLVKGPTVLLGYVENANIVSAVDKSGWYHTGDKVSLNQYETLFYHGRMDNMIKYSGYRIEPAEIEQALLSIDGIVECVVIAIKKLHQCRPAAMLVTEGDITATSVMKQLRELLPSYMLPTDIKLQQQLPRLNNGKLDQMQIKQLLQE